MAVAVRELQEAHSNMAARVRDRERQNLHIMEMPKLSTPAIDEIKNDANLAYRRKQAELERAKPEPKHTLLLIKEQVEANNRRGYPHISLEDAYAGYMMWQKLEEEEELEEWWERREHEAEMRLRQDEARRAAISQEVIQAEQQMSSYPSFPMGHWHEREDDLDDGWW